MLNLFVGMTKNSLNTMDQLAFARYDKDGNGIIDDVEYKEYVAVNQVNKVQPKVQEKQQNKGFNLEQFDPKGSINFESNGGFNATKLNIIA